MSARARGRSPAEEFPLVGVLGRRGRFPVAEPIFRRGASGVALRGAQGSPGDLVLVGAGKRGARVLRTIGRPDVARDVVEGLMLDRGLWRRFAPRVEEEVSEVAIAPSGAVPEGRTDLRDLPTFTIDPPSARDFDDAISATRQDDGGIRVWVHIADVSAYVAPGSLIDREAYRRATSTYVPGAVEPMLPEALSNGVCSLRPGEDRLAVTVEMDVVGIDVRRVRFMRSLIRSDKRLTYPEVDDVFEGRARAEEPWGTPLQAAREVARALADNRRAAGALEVNSTEPQFTFDSAGGVEAVAREVQTESHELIEQLMILANEQVAGYLADAKLPTLYRVHEKPDPTSVERMLDQMESLEVPVPSAPENMSPQQAADVAAEASRLAAAEARRSGRGETAFGSLVLRSLKQAYYASRNLGHAGLASPRYCHFTSPIRRYPDLIAHRALLAGIGAGDQAPRASDLADAGIECSDREREAMKIERAADDVCLAFLLERTLGEGGGGDPPAFEGEVVGLVGGGAFVRFGEQGFEGFLPVRRLDGWYELNEQGTALEPRDRGAVVRMGDPVGVVVERVDAPRGRVDLSPAV